MRQGAESSAKQSFHCTRRFCESGSWTGHSWAPVSAPPYRGPQLERLEDREGLEALGLESLDMLGTSCGTRATSPHGSLRVPRLLWHRFPRQDVPRAGWKLPCGVCMTPWEVTETCPGPGRGSIAMTVR